MAIQRPAGTAPLFEPSAIDPRTRLHGDRLRVPSSSRPAFEIYSSQCANRDDEDAALHRYLHQTTAQARSLIEIALERVAEAEGIDY